MTTALATRPASKPPAEVAHATTDGPEPLAIDAAELGAMMGLSGRTIFRLESAGKLPRSFRIGGSRRWSLAEARAWVAAGCPDRTAWERQKIEAR